MATRRDQLQSYQYLMQRVISALVMRETDPAQSPLRRGIGAVFGGVMVTILVAAGFGVYGILTRIGTDTWRVSGSVVVERETGASFVYLDDRLYPTLNYTSALLASGMPRPVVSRVASNALAEVPRGVTIGIQGAPDSLPGPERLLGLPWTVCAQPDRDPAGRLFSTVSLVVGSAPSGGTELGEQALLVTDEVTEETYLVWQGHRHLLREPAMVVPALFGEMVNAYVAGTAWLNALPVGMDIGPIQIPDRDQASPAIPNRRIGEVLVAETASGPQHYLVLDDGLAPITELQKDILVAQFAVDLVTVSISEATAAPASARFRTQPGEVPPPPTAPALRSPGPEDLLCAVTTDASAVPTVWVGGTVAGLADALPTMGFTEDGVSLTDRVLVPAGYAAVVRVIGAPGGETGAYYLVTDAGRRYAVPSFEVLVMLGYDPTMAVDVPSHLVTRIPEGPALDPRAALQPVTDDTLQSSAQ